MRQAGCGGFEMLNQEGLWKSRGTEAGKGGDEGGEEKWCEMEEEVRIGGGVQKGWCHVFRLIAESSKAISKVQATNTQAHIKSSHRPDLLAVQASSHDYFWTFKIQGYMIILKLIFFLNWSKSPHFNNNKTFTIFCGSVVTLCAKNSSVAILQGENVWTPFVCALTSVLATTRGISCGRLNEDWLAGMARGSTGRRAVIG